MIVFQYNNGSTVQNSRTRKLNLKVYRTENTQTKLNLLFTVDKHRKLQETWKQNKTKPSWKSKVSLLWSHNTGNIKSTFPGIDSEHKDTALTIQSNSKLTKVCESKDKDIGLTCWQLPYTEK